MKNLAKYYLLFFFSIVHFIVNAQNVSYYVLGETELKNADIYSILQTQDQRLYVATDEGLYEYKHGAMQVIEAAVGQLGISLFNLRENSKGDVFCYNLNGQVFKVQGNNLLLFAEIPSEYLAQSLDMEIDENDQLIFASESCFIISENYIQKIYSNTRGLAKGITKLPNGDLYLARQQNDTLLKLSNGKLIPNVILTDDKKTNSPIFFYQLKNKLVNSNLLNSVTKNKTKNAALNSKTIYTQFNDSIIWRRNYTSGVEVIKEIDKKLVVANNYFDDVFISEISQGPTGLLFFGTFGKGLFVVPNLNTQQYNLNGLGNNIQSIAADNFGNVFISDRIDGIFNYNGNIIRIDTSRDYVPEKLFILNKFKQPNQSKYSSLFYNKYGIRGAVKNVYEVDTETFVLSTSLGVAKYGSSTIINDSLWFQNKGKKEFTLTGIKERCSDAVFDANNNELYVSTISSLIKITSEGKRAKILFKNKHIIANDLLLYNNQLWVGTQDYGILIFQDGLFKKQISAIQPLENNFIYKLQERDDYIYILHKSGFQIHSPKNNSWKTIGRSESIETGAIEDFTLGRDNIWFAANAKLLSLPISNIPDRPVDFKVRIDSVRVGNKKVDVSENGNFSYKQNSLSIHPDFKGVLYDKEAYYKYQLKGLDKNQKQIPVTESSIIYDYLPSGSYTFSVTAHYRGSKSETLHYQFTIEKPYWQTWWFLTFGVLLLLTSIWFIIFFRNRKIKQANEVKLEQQTLKTDLIESQLKALRSQMNPHFIFNSLNSIQDLILQKDTDASYDYIVLFSNLVRNALNYSNEAFITLEKEIEFLRTYLKLEELRFGTDFSYSIESNASNTIQVPSLIVQPFVENAIVHGLFHKESERKLSIHFELRETLLICTIIDNGVGRAKALEIQKRQGAEHTSFALNSIHKRLEILKKKYDANIGFTIIDLYDDETKIASGTKVEITLPYLD